MKILIKESKRYKLITDWLDKTYGNKLIYTRANVNYSWGYLKDLGGETIFLYSEVTGSVTLNNEGLNNIIKTIFDIEDSEFFSIFGPWIEKNYNKPVKSVYPYW